MFHNWQLNWRREAWYYQCRATLQACPLWKAVDHHALGYIDSNSAQMSGAHVYIIIIGWWEPLISTQLKVYPAKWMSYCHSKIICFDLTSASVESMTFCKMRNKIFDFSSLRIGLSISRLHTVKFAFRRNGLHLYHSSNIPHESTGECHLLDFISHLICHSS